MQKKKKKRNAAVKYIKIRNIEGKEKRRQTPRNILLLSSPQIHSSQRSYPFSRDSAIPAWIKPEIIPRTTPFLRSLEEEEDIQPLLREERAGYTQHRRRDGRSLDRCPLSQHPSPPFFIRSPSRENRRKLVQNHGSRLGGEEGGQFGCFVSSLHPCAEGGAKVGPWKNDVQSWLGSPPANESSRSREIFLFLIFPDNDSLSDPFRFSDSRARARVCVLSEGRGG